MLITGALGINLEPPGGSCAHRFVATDLGCNVFPLTDHLYIYGVPRKIMLITGALGIKLEPPEGSCAHRFVATDLGCNVFPLTDQLYM
jgi:hypothetical protein